MDEALLSLATKMSAEQRWAAIGGPVLDPDPLRAVERLRREHPEWSAALASAVATQRDLGQRARATGAVPRAPWLLTRTGLEQSTRPEVAAHRADRLVRAGVASVLDLSAGLGGDAWACTNAGLSVVAIERDPLTAALCQANVPTATVICADSTQVDLDEVAHLPGVQDVPAVGGLPEPVCLLIDPGRRAGAQRPDGARAAPERDPGRWTPPWGFVEDLRARFEWVAAKAPGGFDPAEHWSAEWIGVGDYIAECAVYSGPVLAVPRHRGEVHPVFHRALDALCGFGANRLTDSTTWITANRPDAPGTRWFSVLASGPISQVVATARQRGVDAVALKSRESRIAHRDLRSRVGIPDGNRFAIVFVKGLDHVILAERLGE
jgi:hypothetical protein